MSAHRHSWKKLKTRCSTCGWTRGRDARRRTGQAAVKRYINVPILAKAIASLRYPPVKYNNAFGASAHVEIDYPAYATKILAKLDEWWDQYESGAFV